MSSYKLCITEGCSRWRGHPDGRCIYCHDAAISGRTPKPLEAPYPMPIDQKAAEQRAASPAPQARIPGLSRGLGETLRALDRRQGTIAELAQEMGLQVRALYQRLRTLVDREFIAKPDRGWESVTLTPKGRAALEVARG